MAEVTLTVGLVGPTGVRLQLTVAVPAGPATISGIETACASPSAVVATVADRVWVLGPTVKTQFPVACPAAQTPLYVRPPPLGSIRHGPGSARRHRSLKALICRVFLFDCAKRQCRGQVVEARQAFSLPSSIG